MPTDKPKTRIEKILYGAAVYASYYRSNPHRFAEDYLHLKLKLFQKILLVMMNMCTSFVFIACRGLGKTFLSAVFCVTRAILYPGTKIVIASGTRGQSLNVLEKIMLELKPLSPELAAEIDEKQTTINGTKAQIVFRNGSFIKVVTAKDSARGSRANILLIDEFRLVSKDVVDTILRKFLTNPRMPRYEQLSESDRQQEYKKERNKTLYLTSAYFKDHWSFTKCKDNTKFMLDENRQDFICAFPYQLSIAEGLLSAEDVADQMSESDFSEVKWSMEMDALFYGSAEGAFFDFDSISKNRRIKYPMLPDRTLSKLEGAPKLKILPKQNGEIRILSADIALMSSRKHDNDATSIFVNILTPTKAGRYTSNIVYLDTAEGLRTDVQALEIRRLYEDFSCDYIVLDTNGIGLGVFDALARDIVDPDSGEIYPALSCINNSEMASRCTVVGAPKVIWSIKASAQFNSDCAFLLREGFKSGRIGLLANEYDADEYLSEVRGYMSLNPAERVRIQMPYINTTLLIDELVNLQHEETGGKIRIYEKYGMRKDRYSGLAYNYYVALQLENKYAKQQISNKRASEIFMMRAPKQSGRR